MEQKARKSNYERLLQQDTLAIIRNLMFMFPATIPHGWDDKSARILQFLLNEEVLTRQDVLSCLDQRVKALGRWCFNQHINAGTHPDHTGLPEMFAYALAHGEFSDIEISCLKFAQGESLASFISEHKADGDGLLHKILQNLLPKQRHLATA